MVLKTTATTDVSLFRPLSGSRAILVHIDFNHTDKQTDYITEFKELALAAGINAVQTISLSRDKPDSKYFVGTGKAEEIRSLITAMHADLVLFNHQLSPGQERNLEKFFNCRVLDRTGLILEIFAQRARTFEGKLQVELAQLQHVATRLVRGWTHLERQKGGIGLRGGPGETQLEVDRRLIRKRMKVITERLEKVRLQRDLGRRARRRAEIPVISFVGYTNAGKSTLFNQLTVSEVFVANQLFATLDPTLRQIRLPQLGEVVVADTVGFIRDLPHELVEAFRATLEETLQADLLIHVIDAHNPERQLYVNAVDKVIEEIGGANIPKLLVYNKVDLLVDQHPRIDRDENGRPVRIWLSALSGEGIDLLKQVLIELLNEELIDVAIRLSLREGQLRAKLYQEQVVIAETIDESNGGWQLHLRVPKVIYRRLFG